MQISTRLLSRDVELSIFSGNSRHRQERRTDR